VVVIVWKLDLQLPMSWWSVLLVEEILVLGENHLPAANHLTSLSHNMLYRIEYTATEITGVP
jgi:hypothetical protein